MGDALADSGLATPVADAAGIAGADAACEELGDTPCVRLALFEGDGEAVAAREVACVELGVAVGGGVADCDALEDSAGVADADAVPVGERPVVTVCEGEGVCDAVQVAESDGTKLAACEADRLAVCESVWPWLPLDV